MELNRDYIVLTITLLYSLTVTINAAGPSQSDTRVYEPLYVVETSNKYNFVDTIVLKSAKTPRFRQSTGKTIEVACPKPISTESLPNDDNIMQAKTQLEIGAMPNKNLFNYDQVIQAQKLLDEEKLLEIVELGGSEMAMESHCLHPVQPIMLKSPHSENYIIAFVIYKENGQSIRPHPYDEILPPTHYPITLIQISNRVDSNTSSLSTRHTIKYGNMLPAKTTLQQDDTLPYHSLWGVHGYPIDTYYSPENQLNILTKFFGHLPTSSLVKIQLSPESDFLFESWKNASRANLNTVPVWEQLVPQWRQLEEFVRRVAQVLDELSINTGGFDTYHIFDKDGVMKELNLPEKGDEKGLPVPLYLWKAVELHQKYQNRWYRNGILFVMHNDPFQEVKPVCEQDIAQDLGWHFLDKGQQLRSPMYACAMNMDTMAAVQSYNVRTYEPFNLNEVNKLITAKNGKQSWDQWNVVRLMNDLKEKLP